MKKTVTLRALEQRIKRKLAKDGRQLRRSRPADAHNLGTYYIIDTRLNAVVDPNIEDLEALGREFGALEGWEEVSE
jgi:hypothetical protein